MTQLRLRLTDEILAQVVSAVAERTGNVIGNKQINMIESRLTKRALTLGIKDEKEYLTYFSKNRASELEELISLLTVHHTYFFREFSQFEYLTSHALPAIIPKLKAEGRNKIRIWSAACSHGQEAYSLYMHIDQYLKANAPNFTIEIVGTDVDRESVRIATNGVYPWDDVKEIPLAYLTQYWVRGTGDISNFAKIKDTVRKACSFKQVNLMETGEFSRHGQFDIIFCRNVFIYFQAADVQRISEALAGQLYPLGHFFVGLSESLTANPRNLKKLGPSIYGPEIAVETKAPANVAAEKLGPLRVICVDDSPVILKLLKAILTKEHGFDVVATAASGLEAAKLVEMGTKFDVMTLDVHMPEMTGVEYLEKKLKANHPPVVMLTSASRDNMDLAYKAMELGAKDYIEKPSLSDLQVRADEIRAKLRLVSKAPAAKTVSTAALQLEKQFKTSMAIRSVDDKVNVIFADDRKMSDVISMLKDSSFASVPGIVVVMGDKTSVDKVFEKLKTEKSVQPKLERLVGSTLSSKFYVCSYDDFKRHSISVGSRKVCYSVLSNLTRTHWESCPKPKQMKILLSEDIDRSVFLNVLPSVFVTPATSFAYMSSEFFGKSDMKAAG